MDDSLLLTVFSNDDVFAFVIEHWKTLRGVVKNCCKNQYHLIDDIWSDVVYTAVFAAFSTYDESIGLQTFEQHVFNTVKWYVVKWWSKRQLEYERQPRIDDIKVELHQYYLHNIDIEAIEQVETVQTVLGHLTEFERQLFALRFGLGWSYQEIAKQLNVNRGLITNPCE